MIRNVGDGIYRRLLFIVIFIITLTGCITNNDKFQVSTPIKVEIYTNRTVAQPLKINAKNLNIKESTEQLLVAYLDSLKSKETSTNEMIETYVINEIIIVKKSSDYYQAQAEISLKPYSNDTDWVFGGYQIDDNGWIKNKLILINITIDGYFHIIESISPVLSNNIDR